MSIKMCDRIQTAYHEAAHIVIALLLGETVHRATIVPDSNTGRLGSALCSTDGDPWNTLLFLAAGEAGAGLAPKGEVNTDETLDSEILTQQHSAWRERFRKRLDASDPTLFARLTSDEVDGLTADAMTAWNVANSDRGQADQIAAAAFDCITDEQFSMLWETAQSAARHLLLAHQDQLQAIASTLLTHGVLTASDLQEVEMANSDPVSDQTSTTTQNPEQQIS